MTHAGSSTRPLLAPESSEQEVSTAEVHSLPTISFPQLSKIGFWYKRSSGWRCSGKGSFCSILSPCAFPNCICIVRIVRTCPVGCQEEELINPFLDRVGNFLKLVPKLKLNVSLTPFHLKESSINY